MDVCVCVCARTVFRGGFNASECEVLQLFLKSPLSWSDLTLFKYEGRRKTCSAYLRVSKNLFTIFRRLIFHRDVR